MTVRGQETDVEVTDRGEFVATLEGQRYLAPTLDELKTTLMRASKVRAGDVAVPAILVSRSPYSALGRRDRVTITGIHAGNGHVLYRDSDGKAHSERAYQEEWYGSLTDSQLDEWDELEATVKAAKGALAEFQKRHRINSHQIAAETIAKALEASSE